MNTTPTQSGTSLHEGRVGDGRLAISVEEAGKALGISRASAYQAAHAGDLPTVKIGHRILVPVAALERMLTGADA
ncbi:MAG: hypothetical protein QOG53_1530 [Frankiales bacterium]|jgi:excisionase family DNA binding protein|nr:hypothetical protein [Frankiales bacterium]